MKARASMLGAAAAISALSLLTGCASTSADGAFRDMASEVEKRTGQKVVWNQGGKEDAEVERRIQALLKRELTVDAAVQIALLNNRRLQATYEDLSVAQADLVQAGLLQNPVFGASVMFPLRGPGLPVIDLDIEQDFLSILFLPARKKLAAAELERAKLRVGSAVIDLAAEVRITYFTLQGAQQVTAMRRAILEAYAVAAEIAAQQNEAGTLSDLDFVGEQGLYQQMKLDVARSEGDVLDARERLNRLMGVWGPKTAYTVPDKLPEMPPADPPLDHLETLAIRQRLDIAGARQEAQVVAHALSIGSSGRLFGGLDVGAALERHGDEPWTVGPSARLQIPIFDQGQAGVARFEAELRRSLNNLAALAVDARSEVRAARNRVIFARSIATHYQKVMVPLRERFIALSQEQYDAMLIGVYQLLQAKQAELDTYREYIEAVRDYWIAWTELERAVGGRIAKPAAPAGASAAPPANSAPTPTPTPIPTPHEHHK